MEVAVSVNLGTGGLLEFLVKKGHGLHCWGMLKTTKGKCGNFFPTYIASGSHPSLLPRSRLSK